MKQLRISGQIPPRCDYLTLMQIGAARAIHDISRARRVTVWRLESLPEGVGIAPTVRVDRQGIAYEDDPEAVRAAAEPLARHRLLAQAAVRHGQQLVSDPEGGSRHLFAVLKQGRVSLLVEVEGADPARICLYSSYRHLDFWKLDFSRLGRMNDFAERRAA